MSKYLFAQTNEYKVCKSTVANCKADSVCPVNDPSECAQCGTGFISKS